MSETAISDNTLPTAWRLAYQRDLEVGTDYADPSPERHAARALAAFILAGLAFLALPGTFLGVWNLIVISEHRGPTAASTAWIQAHGHAQLFDGSAASFSAFRSMRCRNFAGGRSRHSGWCGRFGRFGPQASPGDGGRVSAPMSGVSVWSVRPFWSSRLMR